MKNIKAVYHVLFPRRLVPTTVLGLRSILKPVN
jgi:hypothetical protein